MGGGLLQLVAYGAQDVYLTGNPQITFFKVVYRRHTNFAIEAIQQTPTGSNSLGSRASFQITRNGDLIHRMYLTVDMSDESASVCPYFGLRLIDYVELEIGGQKIDKQYSHWMYIWNELSLPYSKREGYKKMVAGDGGILSNSSNDQLYIPLEFWFCRNVGLALPLIALQYHEVKVNILFQTAEKCQGSATSLTALGASSLWVDYIFLDTDERRRFAQLSHEYLIEQLQFTGTESLSGVQAKPKLSFNHPCKELFWFVTATGGTSPVDNLNWYNFTTNQVGTTHAAVKSNVEARSATTSVNPIASAKLVLNGNDRFSERNGSYFNTIQPYQHHENVPTNAGINVYSFALKPEEHQPSGTLNMSRIDTAVLNLNLTTGYNDGLDSALHVYAVNYNVLRILSGMGGLAYSN